MTPPGCRAITAILLLIANFKIIRRGRRPRRPVQPCVIAKLTVYRRGGFHIRPCNLAQPPNCQEGSRPIPTNQHKNHLNTKNRNPAQSPGASRTPPPTRNHTRDVGASIARPQESRAVAPPTGGYRIRPYAPKILAPEGSNGEGQKSVKKSAALLRFLAFLALDHPFGVLRGEQPLSRGSLPRNSETFFASFFGHKKGRFSGSIPLKRESGRKVAASGSRTLKTSSPSCTHPQKRL